MTEYPRYEFVGLTRDADAPIDVAAMMRESQDKVETGLIPAREQVSVVEPWGVDIQTNFSTSAGPAHTVTRHQSIYLYRVSINPAP